MKIKRVTEDTGTHLRALMQEANGGYSISDVELASFNPVVLSQIENHPIPQLARSAFAVANDADLAAKIQSYIAGFPSDNAFSGVILVAHQGQIIMDRAWGMADSAKKIRNTTDTQFCIASMGKMFTAVAVLQLVQQGRLTLDEPISRYLPDYPNQDLSRRVTVRQLLDHTGGTGDVFTPVFFAHRPEARDPADYVRLFGGRAVRFEPGSRMEYSNYGFIILGRLVEVVSGETFDSYVQKHIFAPAAMNHTDLHHESVQGEIRAIGYMHSGHGLAPNTNLLPWKATPAGGEYSTANDLLQFTRAIQLGKLVSRSLVREATTKQTQYAGYGLGFTLFGDGGFGHSGGMPGANGELMILPRSGYALFVLANRNPKMAESLAEFIQRSLPQPTN